MPKFVPSERSAQVVPCSVFHTLANTAILCLIASLIINLFLGGADRMALHGGMEGALVTGLLLFLSLIFGVVSLCGIPRYGAKCLLWEGLVSVLVPVLLVTLAIPVFRAVRMKAHSQMHASSQVERQGR